MVLRSHIDLCLFVPIIRVPKSRVPEALSERLERANSPEEQSTLWKSQFPTVEQVVFHENYHFWQGLRLPYLYRYALLAFKQAGQVFRQFTQAGLDLHQWEGTLPEFGILSQVRGCAFWADRFVVSPEPLPSMEEDSELLAWDNFSILDLLECATSLAEWQVFRGKSPADDVLGFSRWSKRNPSYPAPYQFVAKAIGDDRVALRVTLSLINAAFITTQPVRAFVELTAVVRSLLLRGALSPILQQPEPCRWPEIFKRLSEGLEFDGPAQFSGVLAPRDYRPLQLDQWVFANLDHPTLSSLARDWQSLAEREPEYAFFLELCGYAEDYISKKCWESFRPPVTINCIERQNGALFVLLEQGGQEVLRFAGMDAGGGGVADVFTLWSAVRRATGAHFNPLQRLCSHSQCPEFAKNYCNLYPILPKDHTRCGFRARIKGLQDFVKQTDQPTAQ